MVACRGGHTYEQNGRECVVYTFSPPAVIPSTKRRCNNKNRITAGRIIITPADEMYA
jgi:hypothetical protein